MILSQTAVYALRATMYLSQVRVAGPTRVDVIANELKVPRNYLSKILHRLAREGVLDSTRGPHGGFQLVRPGTQMALETVVEHFDDLGGCLLGRDSCDESNPCAAHGRWKNISESVRRFFRETSIAELAGGGPGGFLVELPIPAKTPR